MAQNHPIPLGIKYFHSLTTSKVLQSRSNANSPLLQVLTDDLNVIHGQRDLPARAGLRHGLAAFEGECDIATVEFRPLPLFAINLLRKSRDVAIEFRRPVQIGNRKQDKVRATNFMGNTSRQLKRMTAVGRVQVPTLFPLLRVVHKFMVWKAVHLADRFLDLNTARRHLPKHVSHPDCCLSGWTGRWKSG